MKEWLEPKIVASENSGGVITQKVFLPLPRLCALLVYKVVY